VPPSHRLAPRAGVGSGPIVIGQACEFDYSGTQACRVLRAEGLQVSLVNSNPATIMTDPSTPTHLCRAHHSRAFVRTGDRPSQRRARQQPIDALPGYPGRPDPRSTLRRRAIPRTGLLERYGVELIGADFEASRSAARTGSGSKTSFAKVGGESALAECVFTMR